MSLTLVLADDHPIVRQGLRTILQSEPDFKLVGEAGEGLEAVRLVQQLQPDVLVLDLMMPGLNGLDVARQVTTKSPRTRIVILSMHSNEAYVLQALHAGASAYVVKESGVEELLKAVKEVAAGRKYLSPPFSQEAIDSYVQKAEGALDPFYTLTAREREVLQLTSEGQSSAEIGKRLYVSRRTVESHRASLMRKLGVRNQKELIRYAVERGMLPQEPGAGGNRP